MTAIAFRIVAEVGKRQFIGLRDNAHILGHPVLNRTNLSKLEFRITHHGPGRPLRWLELVAGGIVIPAVAILIATFAGWCITRRFAATILGNAPVVFRRIWFWVMRLVLPVVAAWIGLQYTLFSLGNLCDNGSAAIWCQEAPASTEAQDGAPEDSQVQEDVPPQTPEEAVLPAENGQPEPDENTPKEGDILYHSV